MPSAYRLVRTRFCPSRYPKSPMPLMKAASASRSPASVPPARYPTRRISFWERATVDHTAPPAAPPAPTNSLRLTVSPRRRRTRSLLTPAANPPEHRASSRATPMSKYPINGIGRRCAPAGERPACYEAASCGDKVPSSHSCSFRRCATAYSLPGCLLGITWTGLAPADRVSFCWRLLHSITSWAGKVLSSQQARQRFPLGLAGRSSPGACISGRCSPGQQACRDLLACDLIAPSSDASLGVALAQSCPGDGAAGPSTPTAAWVLAAGGPPIKVNLTFVSGTPRIARHAPVLPRRASS